MAPTIIAAAIGTQRCTRVRTIGAAERYQRLVPTALVSVRISRFAELMTAPFRGRLQRAPTGAGTADVVNARGYLSRRGLAARSRLRPGRSRQFRGDLPEQGVQ